MVWLQSASLKAQIDAMIQNDLSSKTSVELTSDTLSHEGWFERLTQFNFDLFFSPII